MSDAKKGISASQLGRHIGMTYKTAWYVAHRIREAMREAIDIQLGDHDTTVEIDEAYLGGQLRHKGSKVAKAAKTIVIGMAERNGRIHLESMSNRRFESIKPVLDAKLAEDTKEVVTDGNPTYKRLIPREKHARGNHGKELAERVWTTTQTVENAFSLFKRAIVGNYHKLSPWHLDRYMREFCWRYNRRRMQASIFEMALESMVSRTPLPYKTLVAF
jgi:transposase-like protein